MRFNFGPILLIVVGTVLLLSNLGILQIGQFKELLRQWWPALLIIIGLFQLRRR